MVIGQIVREVVRSGARYFPRTFRTIKRADVQIHKSLYGASGGRGVRHGRDIGSLAAGAYHGFRGDELDSGPFSQRPPSGKQFKTRSGYQRNYFRSGKRQRYSKRCRCPSKNY